MKMKEDDEIDRALQMETYQMRRLEIQRLMLDKAKAGMGLAKRKLRDYLPEAPTEVQDDILSHWEQHLDQLINTLTIEELEKV